MNQTTEQLKARIAEHTGLKHYPFSTMRDLLRSCLTAIEGMENEEVRRIKHLNRLATWAQQDPTGTRIEIEYAKSKGKRIEYMEALQPKEA